MSTIITNAAPLTITRKAVLGVVAAIIVTFAVIGAIAASAAPSTVSPRPPAVIHLSASGGSSNPDMHYE